MSSRTSDKTSNAKESSYALEKYVGDELTITERFLNGCDGKNGDRKDKMKSQIKDFEKVWEKGESEAEGEILAGPSGIA